MTAEELYKMLSEVKVEEFAKKKPVKDKEGNVTYLSYLSWAIAWDKFLQIFPRATFTVETFTDSAGKTLPYSGDAEMGYMVFTRISTNDGDINLTRECCLPVLDFNNRPMTGRPRTMKNGAVIPPATMFDVNKAIMRCLVKNLAFFGLGISLYKGEDLPERDKDGGESVSVPKATEPRASEKQAQIIAKYYTGQRLANLLNIYGVENIADLTKQQATKIITESINASKEKTGEIHRTYTAEQINATFDDLDDNIWG